MQKIIIKYLPIIFIVFLAFLLRIYNIHELFHFTYDESVPAFVGRRLVLWHHVPLIGGVTPFGVHLTPYFYWFLALILAIGKLNPIAWGWAGALAAIVTTLAIYIVGTKIENKRVGITASILWAFSFLANIYDRHLWALYFGPLISLMVLLSLVKIVKGKTNYVFLLTASLIIGISADPSNLVFLVLSLIVWKIYKLPINKLVLSALALIILSLSPLIIFDLRHNFANSRPFFDFWQKGNNNLGFSIEKFAESSLIFPQAFTRLIYKFGDNEIAKQYSYCESFIQEKYQSIPIIFTVTSTAILLAFIIWSKKSKVSYGWKLTALLIVLYYCGIQIYGTFFRADIFEHYLTGLFTLFLLIFAKIISILPKPLWLIALSIFAFTNLYKLSQAQNSHGLAYKKSAIKFVIENIESRDFSLESLSTCWRMSGYRYLFTAFAKEPVKSYVDPSLSYLYGNTQVASKHPDTVVVFVTHDFVKETEAFYKKYALFKSHERISNMFGNIEIIIMDNSTGWFN